MNVYYKCPFASQSTFCKIVKKKKNGGIQESVGQALVFVIPMSPEPSSRYFFNPWAFPYYVSALVTLIVTILLIYKAKKEDYVYLFVLSQIATILAIASAALGTSVTEGHPEVWFFWINLVTPFALLGVTFMFHSSYLYLKNQNIKGPLYLWFVYSIPIVLSGLLISSRGITAVYPTEVSPFGLYYFVGVQTGWGVLWVLFYMVLGGFYFFAGVNFVRVFKTQVAQRRQAAYFILSILIPLMVITGIIIAQLTIPAIFTYIRLELTIVALIFSELIMAYGIIKENLFDINLVLTRKIIPYTFTSFILSWVLLLSEETVNHFLAEEFFGGIKVISAILVVVVFIPIHQLVHQSTEWLIPAISHAIPPVTHREIYKNQLRIAFNELDNLSVNLMLTNLRDSLGLTETEHQNLLEELNGEK